MNALYNKLHMTAIQKQQGKLVYQVLIALRRVSDTERFVLKVYK